MQLIHRLMQLVTRLMQLITRFMQSTNRWLYICPICLAAPQIVVRCGVNLKVPWWIAIWATHSNITRIVIYVRTCVVTARCFGRWNLLGWLPITPAQLIKINKKWLKVIKSHSCPPRSLVSPKRGAGAGGDSLDWKERFQSFKVSWILGFLVSKFQSFKASKSQSVKVSKIQRFKDWKIRKHLMLVGRYRPLITKCSSHVFW